MSNIQTMRKSIWIGRDRSKFNLLPILNDNEANTRKLLPSIERRIQTTKNKKHISNQERMKEHNNLKKSPNNDLQNTINYYSTPVKVFNKGNSSFQKQGNLQDNDGGELDDFAEGYLKIYQKPIEVTKQKQFFQNSAMKGINFCSFDSRSTKYKSIGSTGQSSFFYLRQEINTMSRDFNATKKPEIKSQNQKRRLILVEYEKKCANRVLMDEDLNLTCQKGGISKHYKKGSCVTIVKPSQDCSFDSEYLSKLSIQTSRKPSQRFPQEQNIQIDDNFDDSLNSTSDSHCVGSVLLKPITQGSIIIKKRENKPIN